MRVEPTNTKETPSAENSHPGNHNHPGTPGEPGSSFRPDTGGPDPDLHTGTDGSGDADGEAHNRASGDGGQFQGP